MMRHTRFMTGLVFFALCSNALAADIYISPSGNNSGNCQSSSDPCLTISYGINASSSGDTVHIAAGSYSEQGPISINKRLNIVGPQAGVDARDRDGGGYAEASIQIVHGFSVDVSNVTFDGLQLVDSHLYGIKISPTVNGTVIQNNIFRRIQNSIGMGNSGESPLIISKNVITDNRPSGALIVTDGSLNSLRNVQITDNLFRDNAPVGIDIEGSGPSPLHSNITLQNNTILNSKYGIILQNVADSTFSNNTIQNPVNSDFIATGIWVIGSNERLTITKNDFSGGSYGVFLNQLYGYANTNIQIHRNAFGTFSEGALGAAYAPLERDGYATCNWWGSASGPTFSTNPDGTGAPLTGEIQQTDFDPWLKDSNLNGICGNEPVPPDDNTTSKDFAGSWRAGNKCIEISEDLVSAESFKTVGPLKIKDQNGTLETFGTPTAPTGTYTTGLITYKGVKLRYQEVQLRGKNRLRVDEYYSLGGRNPFNQFDTETYRRVNRCGGKKHVFPFPHPKPKPKPNPKPTPSSVST